MRPPDGALPYAVVALALAITLPLAATLPLIDLDEGRNAEVAREMAASGDLLVPHLAGMPYLDKPPGLFWAAAAGVHVLGPVPLAARLPVILAAALTLIVVARLGLRERGHAFATRAVALVATAPLFALLSGYLLFDMPLTLCVTVVWSSLARELAEGPRPSLRAALFGAVVAGLLVKGPVMLAWAVGGSLAAALLMRAWGPLRWLAWWPGWLGALALVGGWFALVCARHPEYLHYALVEETLGRYTSGVFGRQQPAWFVPAALAGGALPWSLATPWAAGRLRAAGGRGPRTATLALGFVLFALVFFTLSRSKLITYLLPALPALAWLAAVVWSDPRPQRRAGWIAGLFYLALAVAGATIVAYLPRWLAPPGVPGSQTAMALALGTPDAQAAVRAMVLALGALAALALLGAIARRPALAFVATLGFTPVLLALGPPALAAWATSQSGAPLARAIASTGGGLVGYEHCYSPGTDYLLARASTLVSADGRETDSNFQFRHREALMARGQWAALGTPGNPDPAVRVLRADASAPPEGWIEVFRDHRFAAYRRTSLSP